MLPIMGRVGCFVLFFFFEPVRAWYSKNNVWNVICVEVGKYISYESSSRLRTIIYIYYHVQYGFIIFDRLIHVILNSYRFTVKIY